MYIFKGFHLVSILYINAWKWSCIPKYVALLIKINLLSLTVNLHIIVYLYILQATMRTNVYANAEAQTELLSIPWSFHYAEKCKKYVN